ncbi:DmpA family aminopeptidase [Pseudochelatococcus sp. B33]
MTKSTETTAASPQSPRKRAREWGLKLPGIPGPLNAITDVPGVEVGVATLIRDGDTPVRTGVTAVLPRSGAEVVNPVWAGFFSQNGAGEMTGTHWVREAGWLSGPIVLTNTFSMGLAHHAAARWFIRKFRDKLAHESWLIPVAAETFDGYLNDIFGQHVGEDDVIAAIEAARSGPVPEGNVGGGTGMICYGFKGGTGTASRRVETPAGTFTVGALVQANHGIRPWFQILGLPVGRFMPDERGVSRESGSIIGVIAMDAPLYPTQLERMARRGGIGIGRGGTPSGNASGDMFVAFSTAKGPGPLPEKSISHMDWHANESLDPLFLGVVECIEEAVLNAMFMAQTMTGMAGTIPAIEGEQVLEAMRQAAAEWQNGVSAR